MKSHLPEIIEDLKKLSKDKKSKLWERYVKTPYKNQLRALWYYISCDKQNLKIERKHLTKLQKYSENPEDCIVSVVKNKYNLHTGAEIIKTFRGIEFKVVVVGNNDFLFNGKHYKSLSAVAKEICGIKVSGLDFFGLNNKGVKNGKS